MPVPPFALRIAALATVLIVAGCGGGGPTAAPTEVVPSEGDQPSLAVPTFDLESFVPPSFSIPSFISDEALEALVPDTIGGKVVAKTSMTGEGIRNLPGGAALEGQLDELGATVEEVSVAIGTTGTDAAAIVVFAYRIEGISADRIFEGLEEALQAGQGGEITPTTVAGRTVMQVASGGETTYIYLAGDVVFIIGGTVTPELLEDAVSQLPAN